ncbi:MAG: choice-of-anchor D domain-containing protein [Calditrichaeota bacterium]|nr:choice-of-anchor D domain-containing protein [Calditrichota bacterium]
MSAYRLHTIFLVAMLFATFVGHQPLFAQSFTFFADQTVGIGTAEVRIEVVNPAETTGDSYRVTFSQQGNQFFYSIENKTTQSPVVNNLPIEQPSQLFDGIMVFVQLPTGSEIRDIVEVEYGGNPVDPAVHVFRPGDLQGEGGNNSTAEYTFVGGGGSGDFSRMARAQHHMNSFDYEIRFDGNPDGRNKMIHLFTGEGTTDVPFSVWNIGIATPDDATDDRQVIAVGFDDSGNPAVYDGGVQPSDGGSGTMFDRIYIYEINQDAGGDINGDGTVDYDDVLQDITNNGGDISFSLSSAPYLGLEVLARFCLVALNGDANYLPPVGTTIRITSTKDLTDSDVYEFATPTFGLYTETVNMHFGNVRVGEQYTLPLTLINSSSAEIVVSDITPDHSDFQAAATSLTLAAGESAAVDIIFSPSDSGSVTGTLAIGSNDQFFPTYNITMSGEGLPVREGAINILGRVDIPAGSISDVWGYFDEESQREYALVGGQGAVGVTIVDVTDPARGKIVAQIQVCPDLT